MKTTKKMQKGGPVDGPMEARRKIMGEKKPSLKKTLNYVKKNGSGLILKDKSKLQEGTYKPTMQKGGSTSSNTTPVKKVTAKTKPVPKKVVPASSSDMKTFRLRNDYDSKGVKVESMKKGGIKK